ncbi:hypothetical protein H9Q73_008668 [Fusarium xylarioides]|nr:hypothetical protein H9Q73_008668 [Fusarium xylarioides]
MKRAHPITSLPYLSRAITELARFNDSITTDHCRIITILVASSTAPNSVSTPEPRNERLSHSIPSWLPPVAHVPRIYRFTATALGAGMWFFLMYRAKKDGAVLLGLKHPWDH